MSKVKRDSSSEKDKEGKARKLSGEELLGWVDDMLVDHCRSPREIELADAIRTMIKQNEQNQEAEPRGGEWKVGQAAKDISRVNQIIKLIDELHPNTQKSLYATWGKPKPDTQEEKADE